MSPTKHGLFASAPAVLLARMATGEAWRKHAPVCSHGHVRACRAQGHFHRPRRLAGGGTDDDLPCNAPSRYSTRMHQTRIALGTWEGDFPGASDQQGHLPRPTGAFRTNGGIFRTRGGVFRTSPRPTGVLAGPTRTCSGPEEAEGGLTWGVHDLRLAWGPRGE